MIRHFVLKRIAEDEMAEAITWYEQQEPGLGERFSDRIADYFHRIIDHPEQFAPTRRGTRRAVVDEFPFSIEYLIEDTQITVVAVFHASRDPKRLNRRR